MNSRVLYYGSLASLLSLLAANVHGVNIDPYGATILYDTWRTDSGA